MVIIIITITAREPAAWLPLALESVFFAAERANRLGGNVLLVGITADPGASRMFQRAGLSHARLEREEDVSDLIPFLIPDGVAGVLIWDASRYMHPDHLTGALDLTIIDPPPSHATPNFVWIDGDDREFDYPPYA